MNITFFSSVEFGSYMKGMAIELRKYGYDVKLKHYVSSYSYRAAKSIYHRILVRIKMYLMYPIYLGFYQLKNNKSGIDVICSNTFYGPIIGATLAPKNRHVFHLVYDLFPDALIKSGTIKRDQVVAKLIENLIKVTFRVCTYNIFIGKRLLYYTKARYKYLNKNYVIPVGANSSIFCKERIRKITDAQNKYLTRKNEQIITFLYCGNMGRLHDIETLIRALQYINSSLKKNKLHDKNSNIVNYKNLKINFHSNGTGYNLLKEKANNLNYLKDNLQFSGMLEDVDWVHRMVNSDIALVTMRKGAEEVVFPSKCFSALMAGQAILGICPYKSDLADLIIENKCGWVVEPGNLNGLISVINLIIQQPSLVKEMQKNAYLTGITKYDEKNIAKYWDKLFRRFELNES